MATITEYLRCVCGAYFWGFNQKLCPVCFEKKIQGERLKRGDDNS